MPETTRNARMERLYCSFWLGDCQFGVPAHLIREVRTTAVLTPIPGAPPAVCGYVNLRGQLYLVLDPRALWIGRTDGAHPNGHLIVFKEAAGESFAVQTDSVGDIVAIDDEQISVPTIHRETGAPAESEPQCDRLVTGIARLDDALVTLVDPSELLSAVFRGNDET